MYPIILPNTLFKDIDKLLMKNVWLKGAFVKLAIDTLFKCIFEFLSFQVLFALFVCNAIIKWTVI